MSARHLVPLGDPSWFGCAALDKKTGWSGDRTSSLAFFGLSQMVGLERTCMLIRAFLKAYNDSSRYLFCSTRSALTDPAGYRRGRLVLPFMIVSFHFGRGATIKKTSILKEPREVEWSTVNLEKILK